jgi:glycosyltransferase involved in cell wall biosynthesis
MHFAVMGRILDYDGYGIQTYLSGLLGGITEVQHSHKITVLLGRGQALPGELRSKNLQAIDLGLKVSNKRDGVATRLLWDHLAVGMACRRMGVDALLAPAHIRPMYAPCPVVVTIHDMLYHLHPEDWSLFDQLYFRLGVNLLTTRAALVHAVSENTRQDAIRLLGLPEKRVRLVLHGVPAGFSQQNEQAGRELRHKYSLGTPFLFYAGSFHPRKNLEGALAAYEKIYKQIDHDFVIAGIPVWNEKRFQERLESSPAVGRIRVLGLVPRHELPVLYSQADLFVFPSLYEGFGFPILEAMACGCAVLATSSSSIPEVAGDAALLVPPGDEQALSEAMLHLLSDPELRARLRQRGFEQANRFSWIKAARQVLGLLEEAALSGCFAG